MTNLEDQYIWDLKPIETTEEKTVDAGLDEEFLCGFRLRLKECVERCGGIYDERVRRMGERMIGAFAGQNIHSYTLDYGSRYEAISITLLLDDGLEFFVRCEKGDEEDDMIEFSVSRGDYVIRSSFDRLSLFRQHVEEFFRIRQQEYHYDSISQRTSTTKELRTQLAV